MRAGRLRVLGFSHRGTDRSSYWSCVCDCGTKKAVRGDHLRKGRTVSCGCIQGERHGCAKTGHVTAEYQTWASMKRRCLTPTCPEFRYYGGRGITVCEAWVKSFSTFLRDVGPRPSPNHTLDRYPNNDGGYEPGNVRWVEMAAQCRNKSNNRNLTHSGETLCLSDWAGRLGMAESTLRKRVKAWGVERALTTPIATEKRTRKCELI